MGWGKLRVFRVSSVNTKLLLISMLGTVLSMKVLAGIRKSFCTRTVTIMLWIPTKCETFLLWHMRNVFIVTYVRCFPTLIFISLTREMQCEQNLALSLFIYLYIPLANEIQNWDSKRQYRPAFSPLSREIHANPISHRVYIHIYASTTVLFKTACEGWVLGKRLRKAITKVQKAESS